MTAWPGWWTGSGAWSASSLRHSRPPAARRLHDRAPVEGDDGETEAASGLLATQVLWIRALRAELEG